MLVIVFMYIILLFDLQINTSNQEPLGKKTDDLIKKYNLKGVCSSKLKDVNLKWVIKLKTFYK